MINTQYTITKTSGLYSMYSMHALFAKTSGVNQLSYSGSN
jgi:hypothetical protein